jgi:hypothetical protein
MRDEQVQAAGADDDFDFRTRVMGFAIGVDESGLRSFDDESCTANVNHPRTSEDRSRKESRDQRQRGENSNWRNGNQVEFTVVHAGAGSDAGVVTVLVGIRDGDEQRIEFVTTATGFDDDALSATPKKRGKACPRIGGETASLKAVEAFTDLRVETAAHRVEERVPVRRAGIDRGYNSRGGGGKFERAIKASGQTEMERESVTGAAGNQAEGRARIQQGLRNLVHRAVAPDSDDAIAAVGQRRASEIRRVSRSRRDDERCIEATLCNKSADMRSQPRPAPIATGTRV